MMTRFSDVLASCLQKNTWQAHLLSNWHEIVGDLHTRICLERINGTTLFIGVHDVHWMHELFCLGQELMEQINRHLIDEPVKQVRFVLSSRHRPKKKSVQPQRTVPHDVPRAEKLLTDQQQHALAQIADPQLQEIIRQMMVRGK